MNRDEFDKLMKYAGARFPSFNTFVAARSDTVAACFETFGRTDVMDAMAVVRLMHAGEIKSPERYDDFPATIVREAKRLASDREYGKRQDEQRQDARRRRSPVTWDMRELLTDAIGALKAGKLVATVLPEADPYHERRFRCLICQDGGTVRVWHPVSIEAAIECVKAGEPVGGQRTFYSAVAACTCREGDRWLTRYPKGVETKFLRRYVETQDVVISFSTSHPLDRKMLAEFAANYQPPEVHTQRDAFA